jgi:tetratricopeptide (TPR) repeat protein
LLRTQPKNAEILERLGGVLLELGHADAARKCYLEALAVAPERTSTRLALATAVLPVIAQNSEESAAVPARFCESARRTGGLAARGSRSASGPCQTWPAHSNPSRWPTAMAITSICWRAMAT